MPLQLTQEIIDTSTKPVIINASASWCPHCNAMKPIYEELEKEMGDKYIFTEFDVDLHEDLTGTWQIHSLPTFIFIKNKKEVNRVTGEMVRYELKQLIEDNLE